MSLWLDLYDPIVLVKYILRGFMMWDGQENEGKIGILYFEK